MIMMQSLILLEARLSRSFKVLKKGGIIVSMLEQNSELMSIFQFTQVNRNRLTKLAQWVDQNNIMVNVEKTFPLDEAGNALDYLKDIHPRGKDIHPRIMFVVMS
jgi:NADPH:quinone reductase-like Zn-dependent oxidoreductase